jgi:hypothetical protein
MGLVENLLGKRESLPDGARYSKDFWVSDHAKEATQDKLRDRIGSLAVDEIFEPRPVGFVLGSQGERI